MPYKVINLLKLGLKNKVHVLKEFYLLDEELQAINGCLQGKKISLLEG